MVEQQAHYYTHRKESFHPLSGSATWDGWRLSIWTTGWSATTSVTLIFYLKLLQYWIVQYYEYSAVDWSSWLRIDRYSGFLLMFFVVNFFCNKFIRKLYNFLIKISRAYLGTYTYIFYCVVLTKIYYTYMIVLQFLAVLLNDASMCGIINPI